MVSAITPRYIDGPITCDVTEAVTPGQLVETRTSTLHGAAQYPVGVAAAGSSLVVGVALGAATPSDTVQATGLVYTLPQAVAVAMEGIVPGVTYAASATFGQLLKAAASGQVTPFVSGTDAVEKIVGRCWEPAGVSSAGVGKMLLRLGY